MQKRWHPLPPVSVRARYAGSRIVLWHVNIPARHETGSLWWTLVNQRAHTPVTTGANRLFVIPSQQQWSKRCWLL
jgi:hypothetical protein